MLLSLLVSSSYLLLVLHGEYYPLVYIPSSQGSVDDC